MLQVREITKKQNGMFTLTQLNLIDFFYTTLIYNVPVQKVVLHQISHGSQQYLDCPHKSSMHYPRHSNLLATGDQGIG